MDSAEIKAFLAVVRTGSLTEAAKSLFISQSTLSHRIHELEHEIDMILIERGRGIKSLSLTECGKEFLFVAQRWEQLLQDTKEIKKRTRNISITIGAVDTVHNFLFAPFYQYFKQRYPAVDLILKTYNSTELYVKIEQGELDIAFPLVELPMRSTVSKKIYAEPRVVLRKEKERIISGKTILQDNLKGSQEIYFQADLMFQEWYKQWKGTAICPPIMVDTAQLLNCFLYTPGDWAIVPLCVAKYFIARQGFTYYYLTVNPPPVTYYAVQLKYPKMSAKRGITIFSECLHSFYHLSQHNL